MKSLIISAFLLLSVIMISSCRKEKGNPSWDVDVLAPLVKANLTIDDIVNDTLTQINPDSSISLVYQNHLYTFTLDSLFEIPDTSVSYTVKLDNLDLGTITLDHRVSFGDIANMDADLHGTTGGLYEVIMTAHNTGNAAIIDPIEQQVFDSISIDATQYLQSADVIQGYVDITINNQLPVDITNVIFEVRNTVGGAVLLQDTFPLVESFHMLTSVNSIAGKTINGNMEARVLFDSPGSAGAVMIDTSMALTATITVRDLKLSSATAVFPDQDVVANAEETSFVIDDIQLNRVDVRQGSITIEVYNTLPENMHYNYKIPSATYLGSPFEINGTIAAASGGNATHSTIVRDLAGYRLDLRGIGPVEQISGDLNGNGFTDPDTINSLYHELKAGIDSSGNLTTLTLNDSVYIYCYFSGIIPEYAQGYLGQKEISETDNIAFSVLNDLSIDYLSLDDVKVSLEVGNQIGMEGSVSINTLTAKNTTNGQQITLSGSGIQSPFNVNKPFDPLNSAVEVIPEYSTLYLDKNNSNVNDLISILPDQFQYDIAVHTNPGNLAPPPGSGTDFIYYGDKLTADLNVEVPLSLIATNLVLTDTVAVSVSEGSIENINGGNLLLYAHNMFPLECTLQAYLMTEGGTVIDSLFAIPQTINAGTLEPQTDRVHQPTETRLVVPMDDNKLHRLTLAKKMKIVAAFNTRPQSQHVRIYSDYNLEVHMVGDFGYHVD